MKRATWWILAATVALFAVACNGNKNTRPDQIPKADPMVHIKYLDADFDLVIGVNSIAKRTDIMRRSRAFAQLRKFLETNIQDPELPKDLDKAEKLLETISQHFGGRMTLAFDQDRAIDGGFPEEHFVFIAQGNAEQMLRAMAELVDEPFGQFTQMNNGMMRYVSADGPSPDDNDNLYMLQRGPIGMLSSNARLLQQVADRAQGIAPAQGALQLVNDQAFKGLTDGLKKDTDGFVWLRDWTDDSLGADGDWDAMLGNSPGTKLPRGIAATFHLEHGVDVEVEIDADAQDFDDPMLRELLPAMVSVQQPPSIPRKIPADALGYVGMHIDADTVFELIAQDLYASMDAVDQEQVQAIVESFDGEFAIAITSGPEDAAINPMLGYPIPGVVLVARLKEGRHEELIDTMEFFFGLFGEGPDPLLGKGQREMYDQTEVTFYTTPEPGLEIGYALTQDHYLVLGNRQGLRDMLRAPIGDNNLIQGTGFDMVQSSFGQSSNYQFHLNLKGTYTAVKQFYGPMLAMATGGALGAPDDALDALLGVFQYAGGNLKYQDRRLRGRFYLTARDMR